MLTKCLTAFLTTVSGNLVFRHRASKDPKLAALIDLDNSSQNGKFGRSQILALNHGVIPDQVARISPTKLPNELFMCDLRSPWASVGGQSESAALLGTEARGGTHLRRTHHAQQF